MSDQTTIEGEVTTLVTTSKQAMDLVTRKSGNLSLSTRLLFILYSQNNVWSSCRYFLRQPFIKLCLKPFSLPDRVDLHSFHCGLKCRTSECVFDLAAAHHFGVCSTDKHPELERDCHDRTEFESIGDALSQTRDATSHGTHIRSLKDEIEEHTKPCNCMRLEQ